MELAPAPQSETPGCTAARPSILAPRSPVSLDEVWRRFQGEARQGACDTGRYRMPYYVWGDGPPLVCVPGLCDDRLSFLLPAALLSEHFRVIAYDLPAGVSDGAHLPCYRHADYVADLLTLLDTLGLRQAYVLGSSFGSTITLKAMRTRPDRIPRAVLQGGFARRPLAPAELLLASLARYWPGPMRHLPFRTPLLHHSHQGAFVGGPPERWEFFLQRAGSPPMAAVAHRALTMHHLDLRPLLTSIRQPVLLVCGDRDALVPRQCEEELLADLPDATRATIAGCGHMVLFSHPEALAHLAYQFLTPPPCAATCH